MTTRAALAIWTLALAAVAGAVTAVLTSDHTDNKLALLLLAAPTGIAFVASGLVARSLRPGNRTGNLLVATGFAWFLGAVPSANPPVLFTSGLLLQNLFVAVLLQLLLAFPSGRLVGRVDHAIATAVWAIVIVGPPLVLLFDAHTEAVCDGPCPENLIAVTDNDTVSGALEFVFVVGALALVAAVVVRLVLRWRRGTPALRRALGPVFAAAAANLGLLVVTTPVAAFSRELSRALDWLLLVALLFLPLAFLYGLLRSRFGAAARRLAAELSEEPRPEKLQEALRRVLRDPTLELGYVVPGRDGYVGVHGGPLEVPGDGSSRVVTDLGDEVMVHDASLLDQPELVEEVVDAASIALQRGLSLQSLEASERRTRALLDAIPDNVYRVSADGTFLDAPPSLIGKRIDR